MRRALLVLAILLTPVIAAAGEPCGSFGSVDCCTLGGIMEDDIISDGYGICGGIQESDVAPDDLTIQSGATYPQGTQSPSTLRFAGGLDEKYITVTNYALATTDEVTTTVNNAALAALVEGTDFNCITSNAVCATALAAAIDAQSGVAASAVAAVVYLEPDQCPTYGLSTAVADGGVDGAFAASTNGVDGVVEIFSKGIVGAGDTVTDFTNAQFVSGQSDSGETANSDRIGVVGEAASDGTDQSQGVAGFAKTSSTHDATGVFGTAHIAATGDAATAYGGIFASAGTHAGGPNVGMLCQATGGSLDYCIEVMAGDVVSTLGTDLDIHSADTATAAATDDVDIHSGAASNAGDYDSGAMACYSGATTTAGDSGAASLYSGAGADTSGDVAVYSGDAIAEGSGTSKLYSGTSAGTNATGAVSIYSGAQTNIGDVNSGGVSISTGATTTDGDSGDITLKTGVAGAGVADAGDILFQTQGANTRVTIAGNGGDVTFAADADIEGTAAIGDGSALSSVQALIVDHDFSTASDGTQLTTKGLITVTGGTSSVSTVLVVPEGVTLDDGGPGVHPVIASLDVREPVITETVGTCTDSATIYVPTAATECDSNYGLWVVNDAKIDGSLTAGGLTMSGDLDMGDNSIINVNDIYPDAAMASDAVPTPITMIGSKHPYQAIGATNNDGADIYLVPSSGANDLTGVTRAGTAGDDIVFTTVDYDGAVTETTLMEGVHYVCAGAGSDIICVCNIYAAVDGLSAALGIGVARTDGTCSDEKLLFYPELGTTAYLVVTPSDAVNTVVSRGDDGIVNLPRRVKMNYDGATGAILFKNNLAGRLSIRLGDDSGDAAVNLGILYPSSIYGASTVTVTAGGHYTFVGRSKIFSSADGKLHLTDVATTAFGQFTVGPETNQYPALWPDGSAGVTLAGGAAVTDVVDLALTGSLDIAGSLTTDGIHVNTPGSQELSVAETATVTAKWLKVYSDGGVVVSTADPTVSAGTADGQEACFRGTDNTNTIEFQDESNNAGSTLELSGSVNFAFGLYDTLCLTWDSTNSKWVEVSRSNN